MVKFLLSEQRLKLIINRVPLIGISCFGMLFYYSSTLYPGGSQADINSIGYDWINNYWCNLMNEKGGNGELNRARPFSIFAMIVLCGSLTVFFYQFADFLTQSKEWRIVIKVGGVLSMIFAALVFTDYHDLLTIISSFFGLFVVVGIVKEIHRSKLSFYRFTGIICLVLLGINNAIYYTSWFIEWLPLIQKITLLIVLIWILGLNYEIRKLIKRDSHQD